MSLENIDTAKKQLIKDLHSHSIKFMIFNDGGFAINYNTVPKGVNVKKMLSEYNTNKNKP